MPEPLLALLKFVLISLIYLFFARVVRAVWVADLGPPRTAPSAPRRRVAARPAPGVRPAVAGDHVIEVLTGPRKGATLLIRDEATVGRTPGCAVHLDESTVSQLHARLFVRDGRLYVEDMGSTNGTFVNSRKVSAAAPVRRGDTLTFGQAQVKVQK